MAFGPALELTHTVEPQSEVGVVHNVAHDAEPVTWLIAGGADTRFREDNTQR